MPTKLFIIWDFDAAIGQINATYPYKYNEQLILDELENVKQTLILANNHQVKMIFAITGYSAEEGVYPFHIQDLIREIHQQGHEIASHSWRHEWFPYLTRKQVTLSLERSKFILEKCIGEEGAVKGFVPPFTRPFSWYQKGSFSLGDRSLAFSNFPGANLGSLIPIVKKAGYSWIRSTYRPMIEKLVGKNKNKSLDRKWFHYHDVLCFPQNYVGFDDGAERMLELGIQKKKDVVICGHPSGLSRNKPGNAEHLKYLKSFLQKVDEYQSQGTLHSAYLKDHCTKA
ncbi:polysaccharide deacetylase family protein [Fulvivirgaceae bacterium BMA10]|uniref:Polysaccharide deacetylase family protein n=1 Tax=Splendidivirga corallicola TaxID=3051826 RepID=A0ABT8KX87_9BACT|nr:polysaccharide deacetylase family protein [Fulvivirgaceae bacterium BMA10]